MGSSFSVKTNRLANDYDVLIMNITSTQGYSPQNRLSTQPNKQAPKAEKEPSSTEPQEKYEAWEPFANAAVVGGAVAVPTALGAIGNTLFPNAGPLAKGAMVLGSTAIAGTAAGIWAVKGAKEEFNNHPVLVGISGLAAGGIAALGTSFLSPIGAAYGWTGVGVATAVAGIGAGVVSAVGMHMSGEAG